MKKAPLNDRQLVAAGRQVLRTETEALRALSARLGPSFARAARLLAGTRGKVAVIGVGKSGIIARKIAATLSSTGTQAVYLHPVEGLHGDLGLLAREDSVLALSFSGETEETTKLVPFLKKQGLPIVSLTNNPSSRLARAADVALTLHVRREACPFNIVPTSSTTAMLALGDALAVALMKLKGFRREHFASLHPGGALGKLLNLRVADVMRTGRENPVVRETDTLRRALDVMTATRAGATSVVDGRGRLTGFFTDGDLRRYFRENPEGTLDAPIKGLMTRVPVRARPGDMAMAAARIISDKKIDNMPVVDPRTSRPVGIIDERDLLREGLL